MRSSRRLGLSDRRPSLSCSPLPCDAIAARARARRGAPRRPSAVRRRRAARPHHRLPGDRVLPQPLPGHRPRAAAHRVRPLVGPRQRRRPGRGRARRRPCGSTGRCWKEIRSVWVSHRQLTSWTRPRHGTGTDSSPPPRRPPSASPARIASTSRAWSMCVSGRQLLAHVVAQPVPQHLAQVRVHRRQHVVVGGGHHRQVEGRVGRHERLRVARLPGLLAPHQQRVQLLRSVSVRRSAASSRRRDSSVERSSAMCRGVGVGEPAVHHAGQLTGRHDVGARALADVQQPVVRERADGLADGVAGHPELLDQLRLGRDAGADRPLARGDLVPQLRRSPARTARIGGGGSAAWRTFARRA